MLKRYLEVDRGEVFATAMLTEIAVCGLTPVGVGRFEGMLTVHGVTRAVRGTIEVEGGPEVFRARAAFSLRLPDFAIAKPRYLGVGVKDGIEVVVTLELRATHETNSRTEARTVTARAPAKRCPAGRRPQQHLTNHRRADA